jgi:hypothetical protein
MVSSLVFPINARAIGEVTEIFPLCDPAMEKRGGSVMFGAVAQTFALPF